MTGAKTPVIFRYKGNDMKREKKYKRYNDRDFSFKPKKFTINGKKFLNYIFRWLILILVAATVGYAFVTFCFQTVTVVGPSMHDTLSDGEIVIVNKLNYKLKDIKRYDIIAYKKIDSEGYYDIKRVIGLPGETIQIKDGAVYINDVLLEKLPFSEEILINGTAKDPYTLKKEEYFVLGDNVNNSEDSRFTNVGNIQKSEVLGKVIYIVSPQIEKVY